MRSWFHDPREINWKRGSLVVGAVTVFWLGLVEIVPTPYYTKGSVLLAALQSALTFTMRARDPRSRTRRTDIEK